MTIEKILVVDDEVLVREFIAETLLRKNFEVTTAEDGKKACAILQDNTFDMVITDMKMPDVTGMDVLRRVKELSPDTIVIIVTAFGSIENAVEAMRLGAFNYIIKPFSPDTIEAIIDKANEHVSLIAENHYLRTQVNGHSLDEETCIAESPAMKRVLHEVEQISKSNANVMITGESGTGKEVIAQLIHSKSYRNEAPYIKVNCAAIPEALIEAEFFGHEKGAFTGAHSKRLGRFELANTGTLLLDEVTEVPLLLQAKLLRAIQEQEFERIGGTKPIHVDTRILSTSNRNLQEAIAAKLLREDLFYRLNVIPIHLAPLRERREDIIPLAEFFIRKLSKENHRPAKFLTDEAKKKLLAYDWPGNVRELSNVIERAVVMNSENEIIPENLFLEVLQSSNAPELPVGVTLQELEKRLIIETLQENKQNRTRSAEILGISVRTLRNKLNQYNLT